MSTSDGATRDWRFDWRNAAISEEPSLLPEELEADDSADGESAVG